MREPRASLHAMRAFTAFTMSSIARLDSAASALSSTSEASGVLSLRSEAEALAVGGRAHAHPPVKGAAQHFGAREAGGAGDRLQRLGAVLEQRAGALDAQAST